MPENVMAHAALLPPFQARRRMAVSHLRHWSLQGGGGGGVGGGGAPALRHNTQLDLRFHAVPGGHVLQLRVRHSICREEESDCFRALSIRSRDERLVGFCMLTCAYSTERHTWASKQKRKPARTFEWHEQDSLWTAVERRGQRGGKGRAHSGWRSGGAPRPLSAAPPHTPAVSRAPASPEAIAPVSMRRPYFLVNHGGVGDVRIRPEVSERVASHSLPILCTTPLQHAL